MSIVDESYAINKPYFEGRSYVEWLESFTIDEQINENGRLEYTRLIKKLWDIPFRGSIGNDDDRGDEGLELRIRYNDILAKMAGEGDFVTPDVRDIYGECRVLEMLIALSMRMYDLMQDMGLYNSVSRWFWEIMANVGFDILDDDMYDRLNGDYLVESIVDDIQLLRTTGTGGSRGGWFFLDDWKDLEIWYQMHEYLSRFFN